MNNRITILKIQNTNNQLTMISLLVLIIKKSLQQRNDQFVVSQIAKANWSIAFISKDVYIDVPGK